MMRYRYTVLVFVLAMLLPQGAAAQQAEAASPVPEGAEVERVASGFEFLEGPHWHRDGFLIFSDIPANTIYRWRPDRPSDSTAATVFRRPSGHSNGIAADPEGRLVLAQHGWRRVSRVDEAGRERALVRHYEGQRLNSPNDVTVASDGTIFFTDPPYGVEEDAREMDFSGVYRFVPDDSTLHLVTRRLARPNGIALSPDEERLYVNDSQERRLYVFDRAADGTLSDGRPLVTLEDEEASGGADGMTTDQAGNVYSTGPGGVWVVAPDGTIVDRISVPGQSTNVAWGGTEGQSLFITTDGALYRIRLNASGPARD